MAGIQGSREPRPHPLALVTKEQHPTLDTVCPASAAPQPGGEEAWLGVGQAGRGHRSQGLETLLLPPTPPPERPS
jgi:hypothetical protein